MTAVGLCAGCAGPSVRFPDLPTDEIKAERHRQEVAQIRDYFGALARINNVAFRIKTANRQYCETISAQLGLIAVSVEGLPRKYRSFSSEALRIDQTHPTVVAIADGSPAAVAGIERGDQILTFDNEALPAKRSNEWLARHLASRGAAPVTVMVRRNDTDEPHTVHPVMACAIPVALASDPSPGAFTDYKKIVIQTGILRLTKTDADLATIVGHELAHVNMGHYGKKVQNALLGALGGAVIDGGLIVGGIYTDGTFARHLQAAGARAFSVEFEREADYVGAYYAARAGYDIAGAENIWRALAIEDPGNLRAAKTHPATPVRFVQMQKTVAEIAEKKRRNLPLEPDLKFATARPDAPVTDQN